MWPIDAIAYLLVIFIFVSYGVRCITMQSKIVKRLGLLFFGVALRNIIPMIVVGFRPFVPEVYEKFANPFSVVLYMLIIIIASIPFGMLLFKRDENGGKKEPSIREK